MVNRTAATGKKALEILETQGRCEPEFLLLEKESAEKETQEASRDGEKTKF